MGHLVSAFVKAKMASSIAKPKTLQVSLQNLRWRLVKKPKYGLNKHAIKWLKNLDKPQRIVVCESNKVHPSVNRNITQKKLPQLSRHLSVREPFGGPIYIFIYLLVTLTTEFTGKCAKASLFHFLNNDRLW